MTVDSREGDLAGPPGSGAVDAGEYRALMSAFPTGVAVVTATDDRGEPHGMTCTSLSSVTVTPPVLMICLNLGSGTLPAVLSSGRFAVNLLHARARRAAKIFSSDVPRRFDLTPWRPSSMLGTPWLADDAFALADCLVVETMTFGDHALVLGKVVATEQSRDIPLLYGLRRFSTWSHVASASRP